MDIIGNFNLLAGVPLEKDSVVADITERDAIAAAKRYVGMTVFVVSESTQYRLVGGLTNDNWIVEVSSILSVTYSELVTLISSELLIVGQKYILSDFRTYNMLYDLFGGVASELHTGELEPLILTAVASNKLDGRVVSTVYPDHIIQYEWNYGKFTDAFAFIEIPTCKGVITYRKDPIKNIETGYDYLNFKFRRWAVNPPEWDSEEEYSKGAVVQSSNIVYISFVNANTAALTDIASWIKIVDLTDYKYIMGSASDVAGFLYGEFYIDPEDYADFYTFENLDNVSNFSMKSAVGLVSPNICFQNSGSTQVRNVTINNNSSFSTFCGNTLNTTISDIFYSTFIECSQSTITGAVYGSIIAEGFINNFIGNKINSAVIGESFENNVVSAVSELNGENIRYNNFNVMANTISDYQYNRGIVAACMNNPKTVATDQCIVLGDYLLYISDGSLVAEII